ncbi:CDGSH iron-sulfur domain-containing protein [Microbacterium limosum]|uniref:CDGSH iron-sulfur domain-containing protein n=1 Tax=Microbacterium limosum TaxID=3079935 RepID=A0AAU0MFI2_9MICO|nr:CDGSH iron-sulfur domain-containing protein [Microbacterium sp. Y20]WOQ69218.1 CDGSH iron-sulfur domain-containing protein [Microbacterium sp. Y20]
MCTPSERPPSIEAYPDGPFIIRGTVEVVDESGNRIVTRRATSALCRCGASAIKPWCDGTHKIVGFRG